MAMKTYNLLYENLENVKIKGVTKTNIPKFKNWEFLHFMNCFIFSQELMKIEITIRKLEKYWQMNL